MPVPDGGRDKWHQLNFAKDPADLIGVKAEALIHTAALWLLPDWLEKFYTCGVRRLIAFSSTSRYTKQNSANPYELEVVRKLITAEERVASECERLGMSWTIFRPTLVYAGIGCDRNVSDIATLIRRFGFFPLIGTGRGLRQPVNAQDLATACLQCLYNENSLNRAYNLSGGETLAYAEMVRRIFAAVGRRPVFVKIPVIAVRFAVMLLRLHPRFGHITPDMAKRMESDLVFDHSEAARDFGYAPRKFDPGFLAAMY
jgi:nucleoside-diphosphate-sugar epimerase